MNQPQNESARRLFLGPTPVTMGNRGEHPKPGMALVFSLSDGTAVAVSRRPSAMAAVKYTFRYEVDTGDHQLSWRDALPSSVGGYGFQAEMHTRWRVTDPARVVTGAIGTHAEGESLVQRELQTKLRVHTQQHDIVETRPAEADLNALFGAREIALDCGITVFGFSVHVSLDEAAEKYLREREDLQRHVELSKLKHNASLADTGLEFELQRVKEANDAQLVTARARRLQLAAQADGGLIVHLIATNPEDMHAILREVTARHDLDLQKKWEIFCDLAGKGLIQAGDVEPMWHSMIQQPQGFGGGGALGGSAPNVLTGGPGSGTYLAVTPQTGRDVDDLDIVEVGDGLPPISGPAAQHAAPPAARGADAGSEPSPDGLIGWTSVRRQGQGGAGNPGDGLGG